MKVVSINEIYNNNITINTNIKMFGWIRNRRHSNSGISFIDIYDGSHINPIQVIIKKNIVNYSEVLKLTVGCSIVIEGKLIFSIKNQQKYEIYTYKIEILGWVDFPNNYPISSKKHTYENLRTVLHLRPRTNFIGTISRIRNHVFHAMHNFLYKNNYYWIPTPIITSLDSEGAGSMFHVSTLDMNNIPKNKHGIVDFKKDFFGKESFLTVSGQLTLESYACAMKKVYTFGPTFRAENSNTTRHLSEFWMLEIEQAFSTLEDISVLSEKIIKFIIKYILKNCDSDLNFLCNQCDKNIFERLEQFLSLKIVHIDYVDAINILSNAKVNFQSTVKFGMDFLSEHEKYLVDNYFHSAIIIKNYPKNLKAFYMRLNDDQKTVAAMDLLLPNIGEIIGGSQREERKEILESRLLELGLQKKSYEWYIDLRRYGSVPHSGFGLGFERLISYITGIKNVRDIMPFPRTVKNNFC
ncbi:asparagine--tRNA ligase [Buchnera aphidicola]|uniref:asparagine--tRNA ligase n=1 Tax=Buchnera aphidicola TaxID=9 RepID=UPI0034642528